LIVVAGHLRVAPEHRETYLDDCRPVVELARATPGCLDFALSSDPIDPWRINVFERWRSVDDVEAFRGSGPGGPDTAASIDAYVEQYEVRTTTAL
jgi:quinol monooxygenase YgiN